MFFINSKSLGAPGSTGGATARGSTPDRVIRARFFGFRLVEKVSFECPIRDKNGRQQSDRMLLR
jgi:hypothetical protein